MGFRISFVPAIVLLLSICSCGPGPDSGDAPSAGPGSSSEPAKGGGEPMTANMIQAAIGVSEELHQQGKTQNALRLLEGLSQANLEPEQKKKIQTLKSDWQVEVNNPKQP